jgi:hypothetical protein
MESPDTLPVIGAPLATYRNLARGSAINATGPVPSVTGKGEPTVGVKNPVDGVIAKADTVLSTPFATYAKVGVGMTAAVPLTNATAAGSPLMALVPVEVDVSVPSTGLMEKMDARSDVLSVAYNNLPAGSIRINSGLATTTSEPPEINAPFTGSMGIQLIFPVPELAT